jgi:hypothetical protein
MAALLLARTRPSSSLTLSLFPNQSLFPCSSQLLSPKQTHPTTSLFPSPRSPFSAMPPKKPEQNGKIHSKEVNTDNSHQFQAGTSEHDEWKHKEPYRIHGKNDEFDTKWKGGCHCGRVKYQLSREMPLDAKYCHCTTCQRLHGVCSHHPSYP